NQITFILNAKRAIHPGGKKDQTSSPKIPSWKHKTIHVCKTLSMVRSALQKTFPIKNHLIRSNNHHQITRLGLRVASRGSFGFRLFSPVSAGLFVGYFLFIWKSKI
ncbi:MAG: hypothetical protein WED10_08355, partial [Brumimicrobium sp.]